MKEEANNGTSGIGEKAAEPVNTDSAATAASPTEEGKQPDTAKEPKTAKKDGKKAKKDGKETKKDGKPTKSLKEMLKEKAGDDTLPRISLASILGGDVLSAKIVRQQVWLILLIALFMFWGIINRYSCQQSIIKIDELEKELKTAKFKALSSTSRLTEETRQTNVLQLLKNNKDSALQLPSQPPYIITIPE